jgi:hypothetical protein
MTDPLFTLSTIEVNHALKSLLDFNLNLFALFLVGDFVDRSFTLWALVL